MKHWIRSLTGWLLMSTAMAPWAPAADAAESVATEAIINVPGAEAWRLFTTAEGYRSMGFDHAQVELRLGGALSASRNAGKGLQLQEVVLSFEPGRMLSTRAAQGPQDAWSILYLLPLGKDMTQLRWITLGTQDEQLTSRLAGERRALFDQLVRQYAPQCAVCKQEAK